MLLLAAAAIAASTPQPQRPNTGASVQATATIRVISGARVSFAATQADNNLPPVRTTIIHTADGQQQPARLIEFQ